MDTVQPESSQSEHLIPAGLPGPASFGALLRRYRLSAGLSQEELAERAGLSVQGLSALENGRRQTPYRHTVALLAQALRLSAAEAATLEAAVVRVRALAPSQPSTAPEAFASADTGETRQPRAYLAYARTDMEAAGRLVADLRVLGVSLWQDTTSLIPGTPRWEERLRETIRLAPTVLLIVSPQTRGSRYVADELRVAEMYGRPVCPVWVGGEQWMECIPLGWGGTQYVDARAERYVAALPQIVAALHMANLTLADGAPETNGAAPVETNGVDQPGASITPAPEANALSLLEADSAVPSSEAPRNPYKGLRAFREADAGDFFGREGLVAELLERVQAYTVAGAARFLAVIGPSGSGKSSVVQAGLLPRLRQGGLPGSARWVYLPSLLPGDQPLEALTVVLGRALPETPLAAIRTDLDASARGLHLLARRLAPAPEARIVLVVDQFEELFTLTADEDQRRHFIDLLLTAATESHGQVLVLLTLRADFYDRPLAYPELGQLLSARGVTVLPMEIADLRAAIEGPARLPGVGLSFEGDLVGDLLYEVRGQPGMLPLVQFTLEQLYERRAGRLLTLAAYAEMGGVRGALARQAEGAYAALPSEDDRALARALFLRLIEPGATEQETTRRRAAQAELELPDLARTERLHAVAEAFVQARLLTAQQSGGAMTLEVSHEALIREWARLGAWVKAAREDVYLQHRIAADSAAWAAQDRPADALYRGTVLAEALAWAERNTPSALEHDFLEAAVAAREQHEAAERERQARELALARRAAARLRTLAGGLGLFLLAAAALTAVALSNAGQANAARDVALSRQLAAQAITQMNSRYDLALLLSQQAGREGNTVEARDSQVRALEAAPPGLLAFVGTHPLGVNSLAINRAGTILASGGGDGTIRLWDPARRRALGAPLAAPEGQVQSVAFNPAGTLLASASSDGSVRLWDVARRRQIGAPLPGLWESASNGNCTTNLAFSPTGRTLAFPATGAAGQSIIQIWDVDNHRPVASLPGSQAANSIGNLGICPLAFSPDGKVLAAGDAVGVIRLWSLADGKLDVTGPGRNGTLVGHTDVVSDLVFSPDGALLASASNDGTVRLWDVRRQRQIAVPLTSHPNFVYSASVAFNSRDTLLACGGTDGTVRLWDVRRGRFVGAAMDGHTGAVTGLVFSPDGATLLVGTASGAISLWDVRRQQPLSSTLAGGLGLVYGLALSRDGTMLASGSVDNGLVRLWDLRHETLRWVERAKAAVQSVAFSPDGRLLAAGIALTAAIQVWDTATGRLLGQIIGARGSGWGNIAFSRDGRTLASIDPNGGIQLWSVTSRPRGVVLTLHTLFTGHGGGMVGLALSPDGTLLAASNGLDNSIRLWDVARRRPLNPPLTGDTNTVAEMAFSPDGKILASASFDNSVRLWNVATHRQIGSPLFGHASAATIVAFNPAETILASGGADGSIRLWDVASGQALGIPLTGHAQAVSRLAFTPDGRTLISSSQDGTIRAWNLDLGSWPRRACQLANRNLTSQEWQQYLGNLPYQKTCPDLP